ncbi:MAG: hypothetical protein GY775_04085 [Candidatus Scalindua sp.]|nr:hypothetical protein [Candidatus Scalindua sp.]
MFNESEIEEKRHIHQSRFNHDRWLNESEKEIQGKAFYHISIHYKKVMYTHYEVVLGISGQEFA